MWPDYEEEMLYDVYIVPCRGRVDGADTNQGSHFTMAQLDRLAPLSKWDSWHLSRDTNPPDWVQYHVELRMLAARKLKYGSITG